MADLIHSGHSGWIANILPIYILYTNTGTHDSISIAITKHHSLIALIWLSVL